MKKNLLFLFVFSLGIALAGNSAWACGGGDKDHSSDYGDKVTAGTL